MSVPPPSSPPIINYDEAGGSTYRTDFWEGRGRDYEDRVERIAIQRLLQPATGERLLELGAGFGRLSNLYNGYRQVVLLDYSHSQLAYARSRMGDAKYLYVAANIYKLPFVAGAFDAATMIRVLHHFVDVPGALAGIRPVLSPGAQFLLEYANKRNLKAMLRYGLGRQEWSPYSEEPVEFVKLNFDFHPRYIEAALKDNDFVPGRRLALSYFRLGLLKKTVPVGLLTALDAALQPSGLLYAPSIFTYNQTPGTRPSALPAEIFRCPECGGTLQTEGAILTCEGCGLRWSYQDGIYDFRQPV